MQLTIPSAEIFVPDGLSEAESTKQKAQARLNAQDAILKRSRELGPRWQALLQTSIQSDPSSAESDVLRSIGEWATESGVAMPGYTAVRPAEKTILPVIAFDRTGTGNIWSTVKLLLRIQTAAIPIRIAKIELAAPKEGVDNLTVKLHVTTVYVPGSARPTTQPAAASGRAVGPATSGTKGAAR